MQKFLNLVKRKTGVSLNPCCTLSSGYKINQKHLSRIHDAAFRGYIPHIKILLTIHEDINKQDREKRTPLHLACAKGHTDAVRLLVGKKCKLNLLDNEQRSPLIKAVQCGQVLCASILLEHGANPTITDIDGNTALHYAVIIPSMSAVLQLYEHGASFDAKNLNGYTALILAVANNNTEIVQFLVEKGANVNAAEYKGRTSLMIASSNGHISLVQTLLQHDVNVFMADKKGWTAADYAAMNGHVDCSSLILEYRSQKCVKRSPAFCVKCGKRTRPSVLKTPDSVVESGFRMGDHAVHKEELQLTYKETARPNISEKDSYNKMIIAGVEPDLTCLEQPSKEKELTQINAALQAEIYALKQELEKVRTYSQEKESRHIEEIEILKETVDGLRSEIKMNEEALTQTVIQHNEQLNVLKSEATILSSKIAQETQSKERLETEIASVRSHQISTSQALENHRMLLAESELSVLREKDARLCSQDKLNHELSCMREEINSLAKQLKKMEAKSNSLDCEQVNALNQKLEQVITSSQEKESQHIEEIEILKETVDGLRREIKMNEEALTQTVIQHNEQLNALKNEATILSSKIAQETQSKERERLEMEIASVRGRLIFTSQALEKHQMLLAESELSVLREKDAWLCSRDKVNHELSCIGEEINSLAKQLSKMEAKSHGLGGNSPKALLPPIPSRKNSSFKKGREGNYSLPSLQEKTLLLKKAQKDLAQSDAKIKNLEDKLQHHKEELSKSAVKQESIQE